MAETEGVRPPEFRNELSGTVVGPSIQARSIEGVHFHLPPTVIKPVPHQVPAAPAHFTGRTDELAWLDRLADRGSSSIAVLCGPGGGGKPRAIRPRAAPLRR